MSRYVKAIPGLVEYPSLKILQSQFVCHDGQDLSASAPVRHSIRDESIVFSSSFDLTSEERSISESSGAISFKQEKMTVFSWLEVP